MRGKTQPSSGTRASRSRSRSSRRLRPASSIAQMLSPTGAERHTFSSGCPYQVRGAADGVGEQKPLQPEDSPMKLLTTIFTLSAAVAAATATAAQAPVAKGRGLVVSQGGRIYVDGTPLTRGSQPAWSPNGKRIAFVRDGQIFVVGADGQHERRL